MERVQDYGNRMDLIVNRSRENRVLDLGCTGETTEAHETRTRLFPSSLPMRLREVATSVDSDDRSEREIDALRAAHPELALIAGDAERLSPEIVERGPFDVIVFGDLIEHLGNLASALTAARAAYARPHGVITLGRFAEGPDHVASHNRWTPAQLSADCGFATSEIWTACNRPPQRRWARIAIRIGSIVLRVPIKTLERGMRHVGTCANPWSQTRFGRSSNRCCPKNRRSRRAGDHAGRTAPV